MAIYHVHFSSISRSKGHKASAAAAYRAGEKLKDEKYGVTHDYSRKGGVLSSGIITPNNAPEWAKNRQQLWSEVEKSEKRSDAQLAREIEIALPRELEKKQQEDLLNGYIKDNFVQRGMIADWAIHETKSRDGQTNPHAHVLLTMRPIEASGFSAKKDRSWNDQDLSLEWRKSWADHANNALEKAGVKEKIDHRSLVDQKEEAVKKGDEKKANELDRAPTVKEGKAATALRQKGLASERVSLNEQIQQDNARMTALREQIANLQGLIGKNQEFASREKVDLGKIRERAADYHNKARAYRDETIFKHGSKFEAWENRGIKQRINDWIRGNSPVGMIKDWAMDKGLIRWDSYHTRRVNYERAKEAINKAEGWFKRSEEKVEKVFFDQEYKNKIEKLNTSINQAREKQDQWKGDLQNKETELKEKLLNIQKNQEKQKSLYEKDTNNQQSEKLSKLYEKQGQQDRKQPEQQRQSSNGNTENKPENSNAQVNQQTNNLKNSLPNNSETKNQDPKDNLNKIRQSNHQETKSVKDQEHQQWKDNSPEESQTGQKPKIADQVEKKNQQKEQVKPAYKQETKTVEDQKNQQNNIVDKSPIKVSQKEANNPNGKSWKQENKQEPIVKEKANSGKMTEPQVEALQKTNNEKSDGEEAMRVKNNQQSEKFGKLYEKQKQQQDAKTEKNNEGKAGNAKSDQQSDKLNKMYEKQQQQEQQSQQTQQGSKER